MREATEMITGEDFRRMIAGAYNSFMREHEKINSLNVFPVPDGDTGTNMLLTLGAVARVVAETPDQGIGGLSKRAADGAIMGARGNSGVILSQIFRGIARGLAGKELAASSEVGKAFQYGILYAYRAVARPVEGTILTVAKGIAKGARQAVREDLAFGDILAEAVHAGRKELARTPELLPVLKSAGVVDAGGMGLIVFLEGCLEGLGGAYGGPEADFDRSLIAIERQEKLDIVHPYCTEFIIRQCSTPAEEIRRDLGRLGESLIFGEGESLVRIHIHTAHPGQVLETAMGWGSLHDIKIDNMADQHRSFHTRANRLPLAVISVAAGEGISSMMRQSGADAIISGGETMNPPVEDFVDAVHAGAAEQYIILPNNKNIVLAANQAQKLLGDRVQVIPTLNISQGLAALTAFRREASLQDNIGRMTRAIQLVKAGSVTQAVRNSLVGDQPVPQGSFIGVIDGRVVEYGQELAGVMIGLIQHLLAPEHEVVSLYYGAAIDATTAQQLAEQVRSAFADVAVEVYLGGQPHYHFLISVE